MSDRHISIPEDSFKKLRGLSGTACYVYGLFRAKLKYKRGLKVLSPVTDIVIFTYPEANKQGLCDSVFLKAMKALTKAHLIKKLKQGKYGGRRPTHYRVY